MPSAALAIQFHGETIGQLTRLDANRTILTFTEAYQADPNRPTLSLSLRSQTGSLITEHRAYQGLMPFFANLLPEGALREYLARVSNLSEQAEYELLERLGGDLPGAIRIIGVDAPAEVDGASDTNPLNTAQPDRLRFSLAGVQLKFSAMRDRDHNGLTIPASGLGGSWIVKLPSPAHAGVPENEFSMMGLARHSGIDVPDTVLVPTQSIRGLPSGFEGLGPSSFAIRRFDRADHGSIHIEDFAQVYGKRPAEKYKSASYRNIFDTLAEYTDLESSLEFVRRLVFSVLIGNGDMHLKNWSLIYPDRRHPILSPAYDLVSTLTYVPDEKPALKFARATTFDGFTWDELAYMAEKAKLPKRLIVDTGKETVERFMSAWRTERADLPIPKDVGQAIEAHMKGLPILT